MMGWLQLGLNRYPMLGVFRSTATRNFSLCRPFRKLELDYYQKTAWVFLVSVVGFLLEMAHYICFAVCSWLNRGRSRKLPAILEPLLLEPAVKIAVKIRQRKVTSEKVVSAYIHRIQQVNPIVNAVVDERFQEALEEARAVDAQIASGQWTLEQMENEKPFLGVPLTVKDSCAVKGLRQTVGLVARKDAIAEKDAEVVALMRQAGAIVIGVTNLPQLSSSFDTCNKVYGQTRNPYDTARSPGGSSGGEGSIIASAGSLIGIGTDFAGSIRLPAMLNGIFGHKPTALTLSAEGTVPVLKGDILTFFTTGPMSRYSMDLRPMMSILTNSPEVKQKLQQSVDIKRLRVLYITDEAKAFGARPVQDDMWKAQEKVIQYLRKDHGIEAERFSLPEISKATLMALTLLRHYRQYPFIEEMTDRKSQPNVWWELLKTIGMSSSHTFSMMSYCVVEVLFNQQFVDYYPEMASLKKKLESKLWGVLEDDVVLLFPVFPTCAFYSSMNIFYQISFAYSSLVNILGLPASQFPVGLNKDGLPIGLQVIAGKNNDHLCIAFAEEMEKAFGGWVDPSLR